MNTPALVALALSCAAVGAVAYALVRIRELATELAANPRAPMRAASSARPAAEAAHPDRWIREESRNPHLTTGGVIREFYGILLRDDEVSDYFPAARRLRKCQAVLGDAFATNAQRHQAEVGVAEATTDLEQLQDHFAKAFILVTREGLSAGVIAAMKAKHADVTNSRGERITGRIYDRVVNTLVMLLARKGVPNESLAQLAKTIYPLREAIVGVPEPAAR